MHCGVGQPRSHGLIPVGEVDIIHAHCEGEPLVHDLVRRVSRHEEQLAWPQCRLEDLEWCAAVDRGEPLESSVVKSISEQRAKAVVAAGGCSGGATEEEAGLAAIAVCAPAPAAGQCMAADMAANDDSDDNTSASNSCKSTPRERCSGCGGSHQLS